MTEEGKITMSEFKTVVERFEENQKKIVEVMQHGFEVARDDRNTIKQQIQSMGTKISVIQEQVGLLHEGQTSIRTELRQKPSLDVIGELERRVTRLENKVA